MDYLRVLFDRGVPVVEDAHDADRIGVRLAHSRFRCRTARPLVLAGRHDAPRSHATVGPVCIHWPATVASCDDRGKVRRPRDEARAGRPDATPGDAGCADREIAVFTAAG